jgi:hypothetical protein
MNGPFEEFGTHLGNPAWINPSTNAVLYFDPCEGRFWGRVTASSGLLRTLSSFRFQDEDQPSHNGKICFAKQLKPNEGTGHPGIEPNYNSPCPPPSAPAGWRAGCPGRAEWLCMSGPIKTGPGNILHHEPDCSDDYRFYIQTASSNNWTGEVRDFSLKVAEKDECPGCQSSEGFSSKASLSAVAPPKVVVAPGFHCYTQSFEVMEFFSAPQIDGGCHPHLCGPWLIEIIRCANGESLGYATVDANSPLLGAGYIVNNATSSLCARGVKIMKVHNGASSATLNASHTLMGHPTTNCQDCIGSSHGI